MAWWNFSRTAANNGTADPTQNWAEGQSPSSVNDSARALVARCADFRDLVSGKLVTTGTGTALVLASLQTPAFGALSDMDGQMIAFVPNVTNTGAVTLAVDGLTALPIRSQTGSGGNLGAGVLVAGTPYVATYYNATSEFILQGFAGNPFAVPLGSFLFHSVAVAPNSNFVLPIGQAISRTTYAAYFAMVGTQFGVGDGVTTFNVPDLRSYLLATSTLGGADPGRITTAGSGIDGTTPGATGGAQTVTVAQANLPAVTLPTDIAAGQGSHRHGSGNLDYAAGGTNVAGGANKPVESLGGGTMDLATLPQMSGTTPLGGSGTPLNKMPPTFVLPIVLRVL